MADPMRTWDNHGYGPRSRAVNHFNGLMAEEPQDPSAWALAVELSNLIQRGFTKTSLFLLISEAGLS
jgi:hypothetical protein